MDKRSIVFVLVVGAVFVGLNFYFSRQQDERNRALLQENKAKQERLATERKAQVEKKKLPLSEFPITPILVEEESVAWGIDVEGNTLTLAWADPLPEVVSIGGKEQKLLSKEPVAHGPVLYGPQNFTALDIASLPDEGKFDTYLLTLPREEKPELFVGEIDNGEFSLLLGAPKENGFVLSKANDVWLPVGFYEAKSQVLVPLQDLPLFPPTRTSTSFAPELVEVDGDQKFYVLKTPYQQLVFTNVGGALAEINLPLESETHPKSVVKEIAFDKEIVEQSPANARFPARPYHTPDSDEVHPEGQLGGFYPLLRRGIWNKKTVKISPQYYALNIVSEYPEMAELVYQVKEFTDEKIVFSTTQPHRKITKTYTVGKATKEAPYTLNLDLQIDGDSRGLWLTSGVPEVEIMSNRSSPQIQYRQSRKGKGEVEKLSLPKPKEVVSVSSVYPDWVVNSNGYLGMILDPLSEISAGYRAASILGTRVPTRLSVLDPKHDPYPASKYPGYQTLLPIPSKGGTYSFRVYGGPFEEKTLKTVDKIFSDKKTGYNPDYVACRTFYGWFSFISKPFARLLFLVMSFFHSITHSWGLSIILLTVSLRLLLYPLNAWSIKSTRRMQKLSPQIQAIQQKHKKDPKKGQMEIMALYKEKKVNPFTGCIPIVIQIPFLIAMFDLLKSSFQLRGAVFIPGWINDLTSPDVLFQWNTPIFFFGTQFHLLPILLGGVMFLQQRISSPAPTDPSKMTDQQRQQKAMGSIMTIVFAVMFYNFPSGLNIYWLSSMLLGIFQTWITGRYLDKAGSKQKVVVLEKGKKVAAKGR
ncbi:MAG: Membrane protein insertase YidC [Chlamydiae bacterium]|nr:Membrane protein insertase YidC [Chlamydiota bacterium]